RRAEDGDVIGRYFFFEQRCDLIANAFRVLLRIGSLRARLADHAQPMRLECAENFLVIVNSVPRIARPQSMLFNDPAMQVKNVALIRVDGRRKIATDARDLVEWGGRDGGCQSEGEHRRRIYAKVRRSEERRVGREGWASV